VEEKAKWVFEKLKGTVVLFHSMVGFVAVKIAVNLKRSYMMN
jgi:hypothetical protein